MRRVTNSRSKQYLDRAKAWPVALKIYDEISSMGWKNYKNFVLLERICWKSQTRKWIISLPKFGEGFVLLGKNVNGKLKFLAPLLVTKFDVFEQEIPRQHHSRIAHPPTNLIMPIDNQWQFIKETRRQGRCGTTEGMVHWVMKRNGRKLKGQGRASSFSRLLYNERNVRSLSIIDSILDSVTILLLCGPWDTFISEFPLDRECFPFQK